MVQPKEAATGFSPNGISTAEGYVTPERVCLRIRWKRMKRMNLLFGALALLALWSWLAHPEMCLGAANEVQAVLKRARLGAETNDLLRLERCEIVTTNTWSVRYEKAPFQAEDFQDVMTYRRDGARKLRIYRHYRLTSQPALK